MNDYMPAADAESLAGPAVGLAGLIDEMKWQLPGCDDLEIRKTLSWVFRDFCRNTGALTIEKRFSVDMGLQALRFCVPFSASVERLEGVLLDGRRPVHPRNYRFKNGGAHIDVFFERDWIEGVADGGKHHVVIKCTLVPQVGAESAPVWFFQRHAEAFTAGALSRLMAMEGKAWFSQSGAVANAGVYRDLCSAAKLRQIHDGGETGDIPAMCRMRRLPL